MKARTKTKNGVIWFVYEDYFGQRFRSYDDLIRDGEGCKYLIGYFYSNYWNGSEPIDELELKERPTSDKVRKFIENCKRIIEE